MAEEAKLIVELTGKDADGYPVTERKDIEIAVVNEKSATRSEVYAAMNAGIDVKMILEIRPKDWEMSEHRDTDGKKCYARKIEYDGAVYDIRRHYKFTAAEVAKVLSLTDGFCWKVLKAYGLSIPEPDEEEDEEDDEKNVETGQ